MTLPSQRSWGRSPSVPLQQLLAVESDPSFSRNERHIPIPMYYSKDKRRSLRSQKQLSSPPHEYQTRLVAGHLGALCIISHKHAIAKQNAGLKNTRCNGPTCQCSRTFTSSSNKTKESLCCMVPRQPRCPWRRKEQFLCREFSGAANFFHPLVSLSKPRLSDQTVQLRFVIIIFFFFGAYFCICLFLFFLWRPSFSRNPPGG